MSALAAADVHVAGADLDRSRAALCLAIKDLDVEAMARMLSQWPKRLDWLNTTDKLGRAPIHYLVLGNDVVDGNEIDTARLYRHEMAPALSLLARAGADPNLPLTCDAPGPGRLNSDRRQARRWAFFNVTNCPGARPLLLALSRANARNMRGLDEIDLFIRTLKPLIKAGADLNLPLPAWGLYPGLTPLTLAVSEGMEYTPGLLLTEQAVPDPDPDYDETPGALHVAIIKGFPKQARVLLTAGADPNLPDPARGLTPLFLAIEADIDWSPDCADDSLVAALLAAGADPTLALDTRLVEGRIGKVKGAPKGAPATITPLAYYFWESRLRRAFCDRSGPAMAGTSDAFLGAGLDAFALRALAPLEGARTPWKKKVAWVLAWHPPLARGPLDENGNTFLHYLCRSGNPVRLLSHLDLYDWDVNAVNAEGNTPLATLITQGSARSGAVQALVEAGADPTIRDGNGHDARDLVGLAGLPGHRAEPLLDLLWDGSGRGRPDPSTGGPS